MKKKILAQISFSLFFSFIFSLDYHPRVPTIIVPNTDGLGGLYVTDNKTPYIITGNIAVTPQFEKTFIWPGVSLHASGQITDILKTSSNSDTTETFLQGLIALIERTNSLFASADLVLPLTFGGIHPFDWGTISWGLFNRVYAAALVPSTTFSNIYAGFEFIPQVGYSYAIVNTDTQMFSIGLNIKFLLQAEAFFQGIPTDILSYYLDIPAYFNIGAGVDVGLYYNIKDIFSIGLVAKNIIFPTISFEYQVKTFLKGAPKNTFINFLPMNLTLGVGFNIPTEWAKGIMSAWRLMIDYENIITQKTDGSRKIITPFTYKKDLNIRHPLLNLRAGMEFELYNVIVIKVGLRDLYLSGGLGFKLDPVIFDIAFYGTEESNEIGSNPQFNFSLGISFKF
ncbi:MAG: hypothetical protein ACRC4W_00635 [Treponemataceae bacterium]